MIYQIRANILFDSEDEANDFYHDCLIAQSKGVVINQASPDEEYSIIEKIASNHDLDPNLPSVLLEYQTNKPLPA